MADQFMFEGAKDASGGGSSNTNRSGRGRSTARTQITVSDATRQSMRNAVASGVARQTVSNFLRDRNTAGRNTVRYTV